MVGWLLHLSFDHHHTKIHWFFDSFQIIGGGDGVGEGQSIIAIGEELPRSIQYLVVGW